MTRLSTYACHEISCAPNEGSREEWAYTIRRTAVERGEGNLETGATSSDDLIDAFRFSLQYWHKVISR